MTSESHILSRRAFCVAATAFAACAPTYVFAGDTKKKPGKAGGGGKDGAIVDGDIGKALDEYLRDANRFADGVSGVVLVARDGRTLLRQGYGLANANQKAPIGPDALIDWCSVAKQWTSAAILKLEMMKKLDIDAPLSKSVKECPKDKAKITLRHLLNHTSGLSGDGATPFGQAESEDRESLVRWVLGMKMKGEPGDDWEYSNAAYFLLAAIIERLSGKTYEDFVRENVFKPAGLTDTFFIGDPKLPMDRVPLDARGTGVKFAYGDRLTWGYRGAGGIVASVGDMLAWDRALRGTKVLSDAAKKKYYTVGLHEYALGWEVGNNNGAVEYRHSGHTGHVVTYFLRWVDPDIVVAIAHNEEPKVHPQTTATDLAVMARNGKAS